MTCQIDPAELPLRLLWTPDQVANLFGIRRRTVYVWVEEQKLDAIRVGSLIRIPRASIIKKLSV